MLYPAAYNLELLIIALFPEPAALFPEPAALYLEGCY